MPDKTCGDNIEKMDDFFIRLALERFSSAEQKPTFVGCANFDPSLASNDNRVMPLPLVSDVMSSPNVNRLGDQVRQRIADVAFRYLMQLALFNATVELGDRLQDGSDDGPVGRQVSLASTLQQQVICSRIVLECFFDLIHCTSKEQRMKGKSKFRSFRNWVTSDRTPYSRFVPVILLGWRFDRLLRTPEVHGTSRLTYAILDGNVESSPIWKARFDLTNALQMSWNTLLDVLHDRVGGMWTSFEDHDVSTAIFELSPIESNELEEYLNAVFKKKMQTPRIAR